MKILVVDDSRTMRRIIGTALKGMGYSAASILEASDGVEALSVLREAHGTVDIILADWNMPNMDGLTLLKQLQAVDRLKDIPVIMVTGEAQKSRVQEAIQAGARNYIVKPFTPETLRQKILTIEMEIIARKRKTPTDTAILRIESVKAATSDDEHPFLSLLPEELVAGIYELAESTSYKAGAVLLEPQAIVESLHIVDSGEVEVFPSTNGRLSDVRLKGDCYGELSFLSGDHAGVSARAKTDVVIISVAKADFEGLLSEYPHLSFYLTRLLARRASQAEPRADLDSGFSGNLSMMAVAELVQTLYSSQKTGTLMLTNSDEQGRIYFQEGKVRHALVGKQKGEEAFYRLVTWSEGTFSFKAGSEQIEQDVFRATMNLLMEGMRRQDELRKMRQ